jgi:hypothetical protein
MSDARADFEARTREHVAAVSPAEWPEDEGDEPGFVDEDCWPDDEGGCR